MGKFNCIETGIEGLCVLEPTIFEDSRGYFMETYNKKDLAEVGIDVDFVQDNQSKSSKGVLRGLHAQKEFPQSKLVRVVNGEVYDVAVDLREGSPTYGKYYGVILSADNKRQFFIPKGFAHGFLVISDEAEFTYKVDDYYHPNDECGVLWSDEEIGIKWPLDRIAGAENLNLSDKDKVQPTLKERNSHE